MAISGDEVQRVAHLARLRIDPEQEAEYAAELTKILDLVERMGSTDTEGVEPMAHPQDIELRLRPDEVTEPDRREQFQAIAPETEQGLYLVPKVVE
jgi:aspartyl-tRNA(Asn)/glutamyl-tRNA(Gln) amidotransferase subunit C